MGIRSKGGLTVDQSARIRPISKELFAIAKDKLTPENYNDLMDCY